MQRLDAAYILGRWRKVAAADPLTVVNPATGEAIAELRPAGPVEVDLAVRSAQGALADWRRTPAQARLALLERIQQGMAARRDDLAEAVTKEMGAPIGFSRAAQVGLALGGLQATLAAAAVLDDERIGASLVSREPVGVVAAITPWNFPLHQIIAKIAPALAAGCTVVLKPSEVSPLDAVALAQIIEAAGAPPGVFNLVLGAAQTGEALAAHPDVDMISFTGSTRAGRRVAMLAAEGLKKTALELGGKSANIVLPDADFENAVGAAVGQCFINSGQVCAALSRLLVPAGRQAEVEALAGEAARAWAPGDPTDPATRMGPLSSKAQQMRVQAYIHGALADGARLVAGGAEPPCGPAAAAYAAPTVLSDVDVKAPIAREEVFGPVLLVMTYQDEADAIRIANDSDYGLSGGVWSCDLERATAVARELRTGQVVLNGAALDLHAPFGGVKRSGLGRENGRYGLEEFLSPKAILGAAGEA